MAITRPSASGQSRRQPGTGSDAGGDAVRILWTPDDVRQYCQEVTARMQARYGPSYGGPAPETLRDLPLEVLGEDYRVVYVRHIPLQENPTRRPVPDPRTFLP